MFEEMPLETGINNRNINEEYKSPLTGDMSGGLELGGQLRIHVDHDLLLLRHQGVALLNLLCDPVSETLAQHGSTYIDYPLFRNLRNVNLVRHVGFDLRHRSNILKDLLEREVLVLRHIQCLDRVVGHIGLLGADQVLQEVNCDVVCNKKECQYTKNCQV